MLEGNYAGFRVELKHDHIALLSFDEPARLNGLHVDTKRGLVEAMREKMN